MTPIKQPGKQQDKDRLSESSRPALTLGEQSLSNLPMLTEVVVESDSNLPRTLSEENIEQLMRMLEARIEVMFTQKLGLQLEQLQRQAIDRALDELKSELPELLQQALNRHRDSR